ncbi:hypothetical protein C0992_010584, partial [Termitomyces sp. T32_za158]
VRVLTPSAQVAKGSYLGTAFHGTTQALADIGLSDTESSFSDSDGRDLEADRRNGQGNRRKKRSRTLINPITPIEYDGSADARAYYRFVMEGTDYVRTGKVTHKRRVFVLSRFLKGQAYDFYTQKVATNPYSWDLQDFFEEMFDYCFPINYRMEQRDKLRRSFQHEKTVTDYCHKLEELYNMIGMFDEHEKVVKLWNGLRNSIQSGLWQDGLHPEVSSWVEVRQAVERIEIAEGMANRPEGRRGFRKRSQKQPWTNPRGGNNSAGTTTDGKGSFSSKPQQGEKNTGSTLKGSQNRGQGGQESPKKETRTTMSNKERDEHRAQNKCFKCHVVGHLARNCPDGNYIKSGKGKPPGLSTHNIEIDFEGTETLRSEADGVGTADSISVSVMRWDVDPDVELRPCIGNFAMQRAIEVLEEMAPYPGVEMLHNGEGSLFMVQSADSRNVVIDYTRTNGQSPFVDGELIDTSVLFDPEFNLPLWWAECRTFRLCLEGIDFSAWKSAPLMGNVLALGAKATVREGRRTYPANEEGTHETDWDVRQQGSMFLISGVSDGRSVMVKRRHLLDPAFDLIGHVQGKLMEQAERRSHARMTPCWDGCRECLATGLQPQERDEHPVGDVRARTAEYLLNDAQPYPGDRPTHIQLNRFKITPTEDNGTLKLRDNATQQDEYFQGDLLEDPYMRLANWYAEKRARRCSMTVKHTDERLRKIHLGDYFDKWLADELLRGAPYSSDHVMRNECDVHFDVYRHGQDQLAILDNHRASSRGPRREILDVELLSDPMFDLRKWYAQQIYEEDAWLHNGTDFCDSLADWKEMVVPRRRLRAVLGPKKQQELRNVESDSETETETDEGPISSWGDDSDDELDGAPSPQISGGGSRQFSLAGVQVARGTYAGVQRNSATPRDFTRLVPKPVVIVVKINDQPACALVDTGSLGDFISTTLADQLRVMRIELAKPLTLHLAVQGSRSRINFGAKVNLKYQMINEEQYLDIANLSGYDVILGTPWLFQHGVSVGFNPARVLVKHNNPVPMRGDDVSRIAARAVEAYDDRIECIR